MKKSLVKIVALILSISMLCGIGSVIGFAEETETTTVAAEETPNESVAENLNFIQKLITLVHNFLVFLHEQYLTFCSGEGQADPFDIWFNGDYFRPLPDISDSIDDLINFGG